MKPTVLLVMSLVWGMLSSAGADEPGFQFSRSVKPPALTQEELLGIRLDSDVYAATQPGLVDIRLLDASGTPFPSVVRKVQTTRAQTSRTVWSAPPFTAQLLDGGGLEVTVKLSRDSAQPDGLRLITPVRDFRQRVRVFTSTDGRTWDAAGQETVVFDYSRFIDVRNDSIAFPATARRHFKIVVDDVTLEQASDLVALTRRLRGDVETEKFEQVVVERRPFRIERIEFWKDVTQTQAMGDERVAYPVTAFRVEQDAEKQQTHVMIDTHREPLTSLTIESPDRNFSRRAVVEVEIADELHKRWQTMAESTLSRVDFKTVHRELLKLEFPETRQARYRIRIDNRDSPPLEIKAVQAEGNVYELVFLATPQEDYQIVYGAPEAEPAAYDTAAIQSLLRADFKPARAELGPQAPGGSAVRPTEFKLSRWLTNPLVFGSVILVLVLILLPL